MEAHVYEDGPLAEVLEPSIDSFNEHEWSSDSTSASPTTVEPTPISFAPRGFPIPLLGSQAKRKNARKGDFVNSEISPTRLWKTCMDTLTWHIGHSEKASALEQLRYTIIGSQLLSDRATANGFSKRPTISHPSQEWGDATDSDTTVHYTANGLLLTGSSAFICALSIWWATRPSRGQLSKPRIAFLGLMFTVILLSIYGFFVRQLRRYARNHAIEAASSMVSNAQDFDAHAHSASSLIQEVELVSRGFRLSSPLPPASRVEDGKSQTRRCARLRRALRAALDATTAPHVDAYHDLLPFANEVDLDRYFDMYELSRTDIDEIEDSTKRPSESDEDLEALRLLKVDLHRLFTARKMFLCAVLALEADVKSKSLDWALLTGITERISTVTLSAATSLEKILDEEERPNIPTTPKSPLSPGRERLRTQVRKFTTLSHGLRGLQAKMHILREESDKALGSSDEVTALGTSLLEQYDAFGSDLRALVTDWEEGRAALTASIGKHERRISLNSNGVLFSRSPTPCSMASLGGITEVGSPTEAFKLLTGDTMPSLDASSSDEEVLEAMASPRPRTALTREERIAKMKENKIRQASTREKVDASRFMVKELESVIKARPRGKTTGRISSI